MRADRLKIAVYGAGAMGTVLGALLTECGREVTLITRNPEHVQGLKTQGATVRLTATGGEWKIPVSACTPTDMADKYDVIFLMTKQRENKKIVEFLLPYLTPSGIICTTQNGFPERSVAEIVGAEKTYGAVMSWGATFVGGGEVELTSNPQAMTVAVGGYQNSNEMTDILVELLKPIGEKLGNPEFVKRTDNLAGMRWSKLSTNAAFSGLSVVTGLTFGEICKKWKTRKLALGLLRETFAVANASGVHLEPMQGHDMQKMLGGKGFFKTAIGLFLLPIAMRKHKNLVSGMLKDVEKGRKCEIDYIDGVVSAIGDEYGVATPLADKVVELTHGIENGLYEISYENVDFFA